MLYQDPSPADSDKGNLCRFEFELTELEVFTNDERGRTFLAMKVGKGSKEVILCLCELQLLHDLLSIYWFLKGPSLADLRMYQESEYGIQTARTSGLLSGTWFLFRPPVVLLSKQKACQKKSSYHKLLVFLV